MIPLGVLGGARVAAPAGGAPLTYIGQSAPSELRANNITIPSVDIGGDFAGRQIVLAIAAQTDTALGDISSVTVGGVPFVIDATSGLNRGVCGVARGTVAGALADVVLVAGEGGNRFYASVEIGVYHLAAGMGPIATAGVATDGSVVIAGGGQTVVVATHSTPSDFTSPPGIYTDMQTIGPQCRLSGHIAGSGPYVLSVGGGGNGLYDRITGVTYA